MTVEKDWAEDIGAFGLAGKRSLITGGASGIGEACARLMAARGAVALIADREHEAAQAVAADIGGHAVAMDVADEASVEAAVADLERDVGTIDVAINSAGVLQRPLPPEELTMKEWDLVTHIDWRGSYLVCAAAGRRMAGRGRGSIVNIASVSGMRSAPLHGYGPAKAAIISLTECLAAEWGPSGVRVNTVSPGFTRTPALEKSLALGVLDEAELTGNSALGRLVTAWEVAQAVAFLASDQASGITGINLPVDVGYLVATSWASYGGLRASRVRQ